MNIFRLRKFIENFEFVPRGKKIDPKNITSLATRSTSGCETDKKVQISYICDKSEQGHRLVVDLLN